jgi:hypothetical protein
LAHQGVDSAADAGVAQQTLDGPVQDSGSAAGSSSADSSSAEMTYASGGDDDDGNLQVFTAAIAQLVEALAR